MSASDFRSSPICSSAVRASLPPKKSSDRKRLAPVARRFGFKTVAALLHEFPHGPESMARSVTEAMTINDTWFFRDRSTFEFQGHHCARDVRGRMTQGRIRIWCAAASTRAGSLFAGDDPKRQELAGERLGNRTDRDRSQHRAAIARAREGLYTNIEVQRGLGIRRLVGHFTQGEISGASAIRCAAW